MTATRTDHRQRPRIGIVLGAGGVTGGAFHAGVLAALHESTGWDPRTADILVGTSAGSIAATTLRAGLSAADMLARALGRPLSPAGRRLTEALGPPASPPPLRASSRVRSRAEITALLARAAKRPLAAPPWALLSGLIPDGAVSTSMISDAISALFPADWPANTLWLCTVRQSDGRRHVFGHDRHSGPLAQVVAASCAIPGFFAPVEIDGVAYVDGGVHSPTNADVLADSQLDLVLVSSPMSITSRRLAMPLSPSTGQVIRRWASTLLDAEAMRLRRRHVPVLAFQPTPDDALVMGTNAMDPRRRAAVADQIYSSTLQRLARADTMARLAPLRASA